MISSSSSLTDFQKINREIYLVVNDRCYDITGLFSHLHRHITQILKAVRKKKYVNIKYHICMAFSWAMALANRFHIDVADEMWGFFPGFCPYCNSVPCVCFPERVRNRQKLAGKSMGERPTALFEWQAMFARIYPNVIEHSAMHLAEEAGEVNEAIRNYSSTHNQEWFRKIAEELVDVITNIFGVINCLRLDLAAGLADYFAGGCPKCRQSPCSCDYVAVDYPILL